jgi:hypothetical protein
VVQQTFNKSITALILNFAYILLLVHNLVPHQHEADAETPVHHAVTNHHHDHGHAHGHEHPADDQGDADNPVPGSDHFLSDHQHAFADNKIHHLDTSSDIKLSKKQALPVLVCCLSFHNYLFRLPDTVPDPPPAYQFPSTNLYSRSHALRGPPVA